jgi:chromatin remodeling complex protein RSC6
MKWVCLNCGRKNEQTDGDCTKCSMSQEEALTMQVEKRKRMCEECGHKHHENIYCHVYTEAGGEGEDIDDDLNNTDDDEEEEEEESDDDSSDEDEVVKKKKRQMKAIQGKAKPANVNAVVKVKSLSPTLADLLHLRLLACSLTSSFFNLPG